MNDKREQKDIAEFEYTESDAKIEEFVLNFAECSWGSDWQPLSSAPRDGTYVLLAVRGALHPYVANWQGERWGGCWIYSDFCIEDNEVTHWAWCNLMPEAD